MLALTGSMSDSLGELASLGWSSTSDPDPSCDPPDPTRARRLLESPWSDIGSNLGSWVAPS